MAWQRKQGVVYLVLHAFNVSPSWLQRKVKNPALIWEEEGLSHLHSFVVMLLFGLYHCDGRDIEATTSNTTATCQWSNPRDIEDLLQVPLVRWIVVGRFIDNLTKW
jgi:hypothetical protein